MLLYYHLGCFMGFTMHFYITFGTNLLTQSPVPVSVFPCFSVSQNRNIKRSPNGMKPSEKLFLERKQYGRLGVQVRGSTRKPRGRGCAQVVGRTLHSHGWLGTLLAQLFCFGDFFWSIKNLQKLACQLDSIWYSFSVKLQNKEKQKLALGSRLIG